MSERANRERKVITVLFADLVGFTARAESLDPEDVEAILRPYHDRLRSELERHGGTVEKFIGDAVMALFGAPSAHEDDPERAVRAALAIRDWAREAGELEVRIGVTTGEALVSLGARPEVGEGMASGDIVNTAARLQSAAPVNGILVDEITYRSTRDVIRYGEAEPVAAKGKTDPIPVWEAQEARARFGADVVQAGARLVGRARELDVLAGALARAREQRMPQLVTLVGVPGIGKSRLVYELYSAVDEEPGLTNWRQGRSLPYGEGVTYWALAEMAKAEAGILETDAPAEAERKLVEMVEGLAGDDSGQILESLRPLVGVGGDGEPGGDRSERFAAWRRLFEGLGEQRPTVLVFEDLHWADDDLLDFVDHLVDWATGVPLLVICTARPELLERRAAWGGGKPNALTLSVSPLSDDDTARLFGELLERSVLPAEVQSSLLARAGGNPLYAEQFARLLAETGADPEAALPENVQGIIAARLDGLPADEKQLLQDAAVLGKIFWLGAVSSVGERDRASAEVTLHSLERKEFVRRERRSSVGGEEEYAFRHVLVRDVAYGQIPRGARAERHERAATWIEALGRPDDHAEMLAHHCLEALRLWRAAGREEPGALVEKARLAARDAGDRALALGAHPAARRFYEEALELWPADESRSELLLAYARSRVDDVALDDAVLVDAIEGLLSAGRIEDAAEAQTRFGGVWLNRGDRDQALQHLEAGRQLVDKRGPSPAKAYVLQELGRVLMMADDERAFDLATESLRLAEELGLEASRARNLNTIGCGKVKLGDVSGLDDLERAIEIGAAANSHEQLSAMANLHTMVGLLGDLRRADALQEQTFAAARKQGVTSFIRWQEAERSTHEYWQGRWEEALAHASEFIEVAEAGSPHYMETACRQMRAAIRLARGEIDAALADARRSTELARPIKDPQSLYPALALEARVQLAAANRPAANALADELLTAWGQGGVRPQFEAVDGAWALTDLDRRDELEAAIQQAQAQTLWHDAARRIASLDFAGAAEVYAEIGSVPDEAYARLRAAEALVHEGRRREADAQLKLVLPVFSQLGATAWAAEAQSLLAASA